MALEKELSIRRGETFSLLLRWGTEQRIAKPITGISLASGWPRLEVIDHGMPDGWDGAISRVIGMKQINSAEGKAYRCTRVDDDHIELNGVYPVDDAGKEWPAYVSGGFLDYATPVDMTGYTARMKMKTKEGGTLLASADIADAPLDIISITIDNAAKTILLEIAEPKTAAIAFKTAVTDLEMVGPTGRVKKIKLTSTGLKDDPDPVRVSGEVTT